MAILRRCRGSCSNPRRCLDHLWFDVMYGGARYRVAANDFAVPRMEPDKQRPIESMEEARQWERLFIGEIQAGRDPRRPRKRHEQACEHHCTATQGHHWRPERPGPDPRAGPRCRVTRPRSAATSSGLDAAR